MIELIASAVASGLILGAVFALFILAVTFVALFIVATPFEWFRRRFK